MYQRKILRSVKSTLRCRRCPIKTTWRITRGSKRLMAMLLILVVVLLSAFSLDSVVSSSDATPMALKRLINEALKSSPEQEQKTIDVIPEAVIKQSITHDTRHHPTNTTCLLNCSKSHDQTIFQKADRWDEIFKKTREASILAQNMSAMCGHGLHFPYGVFAKLANVTLGYLQDIPETKFSNTDRIGTLKVLCKGNMSSELTDFLFKRIAILRSLSIQMTDSDERGQTETITGVSVAVTVDNVPNTYDTIVQLYNIFVMHNFFGKSIGDVLVVTFDEKLKSEQPTSELNNMIQMLFGPVVNISNLPRPIRFDQLIFLPMNQHSPLAQFDAKLMPFLTEFQEFVFSKYGIQGHHHLDCKRLNITLVWRRDRPNNYIEQKIFNEAELYEAVVKEKPTACVQGVLFDVLPMKEQFQLIQHTDILIGLHAEELAHALFLPNTSGVIELKQFQPPELANRRYANTYKALATWRHLKYKSWQNGKSVMEMQHYYTSLDIPSVLSTLVAMINEICPKDRGV